MTDQPKQAILITVPADVHVALKKRAKEERRSMNAQAVIAIEEHLKEGVK
jgi:hypothetical protein